MDIGKLFDLTYLFNPRPGEFQYMAFFVGLFLLVIVGSFYLEKWIKSHPKRQSLTHILPHIGSRFRMLGIIGFIFLWIRYENLPFLSIRFFFLAFLLYFVFVIGDSIHKYKTKLYMVIEVNTGKKERNKYIPRQKKKKSKKRR
jgi:hypothetical protein